MNRPWHSRTDVVVVAISLAVIQVAHLAIPLEVMVRAGELVNLAFGVFPTLLAYWLFVRLWWLMREDAGPSTLLGWAVVAKLVSDVYTNLWGLLFYSLPFVGFVDQAVFAVRLGGLALLALALVQWDLTPRWTGWSVSAYAGFLLLQSLGSVFGLGVPNWLLTALWSATLLALALGLALTAKRRLGADLLPSEV